MAKKKASRPSHQPPKRAAEEKSTKSGGNKSFNNENRGALFPNDKDGNEARPDHTGIVDLKIPEGAKPGQVIKFRLAGWERESKNGNAYLSLTIQKADQQGSNRKSRDDDDGGESEGGDE